ncbi:MULTISPECIES: enoyl-CoA hydratase/isomerase family protein [Metallosphaera]|uniref:enoyl-CoA hydratase/isomerase family protein n=1 Tax=Metallosphaera TaxID=41980 RepID=UPI001F062853|nr:enoyl-CoA hydratase/isomerase family protein [Metallosphaera sedula]MCH1771096.1 enoyl-CoA hydratase/isomerase family protein [Metallosphaera sedula]MCP6729467.1 enoyl-CoA hydratase/isomerase family protein [Metallosphaera sedula]
MMKVLYEERDGISWITFNRPEKLNALDAESWKLLGDHVRRGDSSDSRAIVITGNGRAFSSGDDIGAMTSLNDQREAEDFFNALLYAVDGLIYTNKPVIGAVNGLAYGGGCEILLFMDVVISTRSARFSIPEGRLGLIPPMALSVGYNSIGRSVAWLAITGEEIDAMRAREIGLVDIVGDDLNLELEKVMARISSMDQGSIKVIKAWLRKSREPIREAIRELSFMSLSTQAKERMKRFLSR